MERSGRPPIASSDRAFVSQPPPSPPPAAIVQLRPVHLVPAPQTALPASKHPEDRVPQRPRRGTRSWRCGRQTFAVLGRATELASHFKHEARPAGPGGAKFDCLLGTVSPPSTQNTRRSIILHSSRKKKQCLTKPKCKPCGPSSRRESIRCVSITLRVFLELRFLFGLPADSSEDACSSAWLPCDQLCHFISHRLSLMPGEIVNTDGFYSLGKAVLHRAWLCPPVSGSICHRETRPREPGASWSM